MIVQRIRVGVAAVSVIASSLVLAPPAVAVTYTEVAFTAVATVNWTVPAGVSSIDLLCVGGGGAGGKSAYDAASKGQGGGGGGGGLVHQVASFGVTPGDVLVTTVGAGGTMAVPGGGNTSVHAGGFHACLAAGGGQGFAPVGLNAGHGGDSGIGFAGAAGSASSGGGGGGDAAVGAGMTSPGGGGGPYTAGVGGAGKQPSVGLFADWATSHGAFALKLAGGGGGGSGGYTGAVQNPGAGTDGGGAGGVTAAAGTAGTANTGGGGGGGGGVDLGAAQAVGGDGGSGLIVIRYTTPAGGGGGGTEPPMTPEGSPKCTFKGDALTIQTNAWSQPIYRQEVNIYIDGELRLSDTIFDAADHGNLALQFQGPGVGKTFPQQGAEMELNFFGKRVASLVIPMLRNTNALLNNYTFLNLNNSVTNIPNFSNSNISNSINALMNSNTQYPFYNYAILRHFLIIDTKKQSKITCEVKSYGGHTVGTDSDTIEIDQLPEPCPQSERPTITPLPNGVLVTVKYNPSIATYTYKLSNSDKPCVTTNGSCLMDAPPGKATLTMTCEGRHYAQSSSEPISIVIPASDGSSDAQSAPFVKTTTTGDLTQVTATVYFASGKYDLRKRALETLNALAHRVTGKVVGVKVIGRVQPTVARYNDYSLSQNRADMTMTYLASIGIRGTKYNLTAAGRAPESDWVARRAEITITFDPAGAAPTLSNEVTDVSADYLWRPDMFVVNKPEDFLSVTNSTVDK